MPSKKLIQLLAAFSPSERQALHRFLRSPYFVTAPVYVQLFGLITDDLDAGGTASPISQQLNKHSVWKKLFPDKPFDDLALRRLCSELGGYALQLAALERPAALSAKLDELEWLSRHDLPQHFQQQLRKIEHHLAQPDPADTGGFLNRWRLAVVEHQFAERTNDRATDLQALAKADHWLECFYTAHKLRHWCDMLGYRVFSAQEIYITAPDGWPASLIHSPLRDQPVIDLYLLTALMLQSPDHEAYFQQLQEGLAAHLSTLAMPDRRTLFIHSCNYCIDTKINAGRQDYFQPLFELYQLGLQSEVLLPEGTMRYQDYKNIITVGINVNAFDWVENFINTYTSRLPPEEQENALNYNLAKLYFSQGHYPRVIEQLQGIDYPNVVYALGARLMLLKTYYELDEDLALDSLLDSFRIYLQRNRVISREVKQQYLNLVRFVRKLLRIAPYATDELKKLRAQIDACPALASKAWLLEKVDEC